MPVDMPTDVVNGKVVGRLILAVADGPDPDDQPDAEVLGGFVKFTPLVSVYKNPNPNADVVVPVPVTCEVDSDGYLRDPEGNVGVWLPVGPYKVNYALVGGRIRTHRIQVLATHTDETPLNLRGSIPPMGPVVTAGQYAELAGRIDAINGVTVDDPRLTDPREPLPHTHDDRYYTESEVDSKLSAKASADALTYESNSRVDGDTAILEQLGNEITLRSQGDAAISSRVTSLENAVPDLSGYATDSELSAESTSRQNADTTLSGRISSIESAVPGFATDAELATGLATKANSTHTHTSASITDWTEAVQDALASFFNITGATVTYDDANNQLVVNIPAGTGDPESIRDTIGAAIVGVGNISVAVNDAADTITISTTATVNSTDAALRDRSTHTGTQAIATVSGLQTALNSKAATTDPPVAHGNSHKTGQTDAITPADIGAATAAQGAKADTAVQPATLAGYATAAQGAKADTAVQPATLSGYATAAQGAKADTAVQPAAIAGFVAPRVPAVFSDMRTVLTVGTGTMKFPNYTGRTLTIVGVRIDVATAPTGAALIVDVNKNGTTIFTTQSNRPSIAAAGVTANAAAVNVTSLANGDYLTVDIDQIGSIAAGGSLTVTVILEG